MSWKEQEICRPGFGSNNSGIKITRKNETVTIYVYSDIRERMRWVKGDRLVLLVDEKNEQAAIKRTNDPNKGWKFGGNTLKGKVTIVDPSKIAGEIHNGYTPELTFEGDMVIFPFK